MNKSIFEKIWESHLVEQLSSDTFLIYVDLQLLHEVTSPQAFDGLKLANRFVRRPKKCFATMDHNVPTIDRLLPISDQISKLQMDTLKNNCQQHDIKLLDLTNPDQGIVHMIGPELGLTQPGMVIVCGDSHTATHGAFGSLAFGIGTSEVEHVLSTQTLVQQKAQTMQVKFIGKLPPNTYSKDMILALIGKLGTSGGTGYVMEYCGEAITSLSMDARMTICNMSIEAGARAGIISPDEITFNYIKSRPHAPKSADWGQAVKYWQSIASDKFAVYDKTVELDITNLTPQVTWGTTPEQVTSIYANVPSVSDFTDKSKQQACVKALSYMGLAGGEKISEIKVDRVFIGSCTNARIEDLRIVANIVKNKHVNKSVHAMIVPGSGQVKRQAESEGLADIFIASGFDWRDAGCSMCLGMNADYLKPNERCASTSNRNFEGRQGKGGRTHLLSPAVAAATAIVGQISNIERL